MWVEKLFDLVAKDSLRELDGSVGKMPMEKGRMGRGGQKDTQRESSTVSLKEGKEKVHTG